MRGHFHVRVLPRERPRDTVLLVISASLPCIDFAGKRVTVGEAPVQALTVKNADLDFRHVEPAGVLRRLVKDHTSQQCVRRPDSRHFLETLAEMRVEVVEHKMNATRRRVDLFEEVLDKCHEIRLGATIGNLHGASPALGFDRHEQVAGTAPHVLVIQSHRPPRLDRHGLARILQQLLALLVQANDRLSRPERAAIQIQQIIHSPPVLFRQSADTPHQLAPRLDAVFLAAGESSRG